MDGVGVARGVKLGVSDAKLGGLGGGEVGQGGEFMLERGELALVVVEQGALGIDDGFGEERGAAELDAGVGGSECANEVVHG